jgi:hypothetical protein
MTTASMTFEDATREVGFGRFQIELMVLCGWGWAADAMEVPLISFVIPAVGKARALRQRLAKRATGTRGRRSTSDMNV